MSLRLQLFSVMVVCRSAVHVLPPVDTGQDTSGFMPVSSLPSRSHNCSRTWQLVLTVAGHTCTALRQKQMDGDVVTTHENSNINKGVAGSTQA